METVFVMAGTRLEPVLKSSPARMLETREKCLRIGLGEWLAVLILPTSAYA